jgi:hypothetical protein
MMAQKSFLRRGEPDRNNLRKVVVPGFKNPQRLYVMRESILEWSTSQLTNNTSGESGKTGEKDGSNRDNKSFGDSTGGTQNGNFWESGKSSHPDSRGYPGGDADYTWPIDEANPEKPIEPSLGQVSESEIDPDYDIVEWGPDPR